MSGNSQKSSSKTVYIGLAVALVALAIFGRFLPHPPNFAPVAAVALFAGAYLPRKFAVAVPLLAIVLSDLVIGLHDTMLWTWGSFALIALLSSQFLRERTNVLSVAGGSLAASLIFYTISNFGVWLQGGLYELNSAGLMQSYTMGLPFLKNTVLGDFAYSGMLFGSYALLTSWLDVKLAKPSQLS